MAGEVDTPNPTHRFMAIVAAITTAIQAMTTFERTDTSFAPCPPSLRLLDSS
jgi:hypothetical protein